MNRTNKIKIGNGYAVGQPVIFWLTEGEKAVRKFGIINNLEGPKAEIKYNGQIYLRPYDQIIARQ